MTFGLDSVCTMYYIEHVNTANGVAKMSKLLSFFFGSKTVVAVIPDRRMVLATMTRSERLTRNAFVAFADRTRS